MTIVFEAYSGTTTGSGDGYAALPRIRSLAFDTAPATYGAAALPLIAGSATQGTAGRAAIPLLRGLATDLPGTIGAAALPAIAGYGSDSTPVPTAVVQFSPIPQIAGMASGHAIGFGNQLAALPTIRSLALDSTGTIGIAALPAIRSVGYQVAPPANFVFALQSSGYAAVTATGVLQTLAVISDRIAITDAQDADFIQALADLIRCSDAYSQLAEVIQALHDGIDLSDVAAMIWHAGLLDRFIASAVPAGMAQITVLLADTFDISDTAGALSEILAAIADGFYVTLTINSGDDAYTAWVMTPETKAMRSYSNFPFNSYAQLGGKFLGASSAGIYRMGGTTDDGAVIRSAIRTGLLAFGSEDMKAISHAYIGATTTGELLMRVQATTHRGEDIEQTYRMVPAVTGARRAHRVGIGRGFRSVYYTFELANDAAGASFKVDNWHALPVTLKGKLI